MDPIFGYGLLLTLGRQCHPGSTAPCLLLISSLLTEYSIAQVTCVVGRLAPNLPGGMLKLRKGNRDMFAERRVNISRLPSFRAEHFPPAGPLPWLDRESAVDLIEGRLSRNEISREE